jgi:hypothetical protein
VNKPKASIAGGILGATNRVATNELVLLREKSAQLL